MNYTPIDEMSQELPASPVEEGSSEPPTTETSTTDRSVEMVTVCDIQFRNNSKIYYFCPGDLNVRAGDDVIIETSRGLEYGQCVRGNHTLPIYETIAPLRNVIRIATPQDTAIDKGNREREKKAYQICMKKIEELGLEMQLVSAECAFDGSKILFFFTSEGRVDFRELVKLLGYALHCRIELRQIGVRDKAKMVGGLGICGRPFCCGQFLKDFQPVSIKMAKTQNLSLNPTKISGTCGRLMCCLNYEQAAYEDLHRTSPKAESFVDTPDGRGTVTDVNLLRQSVRVRLEKQPDTIVCHKNCDICVLRSGKAKKTDEPIPDDLAPISGSKQNKPAEKPAFSAYLDPAHQNKNRSRASESVEVQDPTEDKRARRRAKAQKLGDALNRDNILPATPPIAEEKPVSEPEKVHPTESTGKSGKKLASKQNRKDFKQKRPLSDAELTDLLATQPESPKQSTPKAEGSKKDPGKSPKKDSGKNHKDNAPKKDAPKAQDVPPTDGGKKESVTKEPAQEGAPSGGHKHRPYHHRYNKYRKHNNNKSEG